jgi:hypothetical protein
MSSFGFNQIIVLIGVLENRGNEKSTTDVDLLQFVKELYMFRVIGMPLLQI